MHKAIELFGEVREWFSSDGRHFQIISQTLFLIYGFYFLGWDADWLNVTAAFTGTILITILAIWKGVAPRHSLKSAVITGLGLSLLLKANSPWLFLFAGMLAIGQKYLLRPGNKHMWNPANFGLIVVILLSGNAWVSPGQWGSSALLIFIIGSLGLAVLSRVKRMETGFTFLFVLALLEFWRSVVYMGWGAEVWLHKLSSGSLWLFALFMITDPMTTPNSRPMRIVWASFVAILSFILSNYYFINASPIWVLFFATPINFLLDKVAKAKPFAWLHDHNANRNTKIQIPLEK